MNIIHLTLHCVFSIYTASQSMVYNSNAPVVDQQSYSSKKIFAANCVLLCGDMDPHRYLTAQLLLCGLNFSPASVCLCICSQDYTKVLPTVVSFSVYYKNKTHFIFVCGTGICSNECY